MNTTPATILVPAYARPGFLAITLEHLHEVNGLSNARLVVCLDTRARADVREVVEVQTNGLPCPVEVITGGPGLSRNVLAGLKYAADTEPRGLVLLVEEDVAVGPDFLQWHTAVHAHDPELFASIASRHIGNPLPPTSTNRGAYYLQTGHYGSIGTALPAAVIREHIAPHVVPEYFDRPARYMRERFPLAPWPPDRWTQQAGLIRRIQNTSGLPIARACTPRAFHFGWQGTNRPGRTFDGLPWTTAAQAVREVYLDPERLAAKTGGAADSIPVDLWAAAQWDTVQRIATP